MPTVRRTARYGWRPDPPDHRDRLLPNAQPEVSLPRSVDLSPRMPPIWNQGQLGSCTGHGIARVLAYEALRQGQTLSGLSADNAGVSRLFIYYSEREIEGTVDQDAGAQIRDGIKAVAAQGAPPEVLWPYSDANPGPFQTRPPASAYTAAAAHKALVYQRVVVGVPGAPMRTALASGLPIVFGFSVPAFFENGAWEPATQVLPLPGPGDQIIGGHCVVITGYDWTCKRFPVPAFQIDNSWSAAWGMGGRFWMHYRYFDTLASDLWTVQQVA